MARPSKHDGSIYPRKDGKVLWMVYRDRSGKRIRESTFTEDWQEAQRKLRERLQARDDKILDIVRKGEHYNLRIGRTFFWRTTPSPRSAQKRPMKPTSACGLHLKEAFGDDRFVRLLRTTSRFTFDGGCRRGFRSGPQAGVVQKTASSQRQSIRNCGCFAVC